MAVPKRRLSRSNTRHRRSAWKAAPIDLVPIQLGPDTYRVPRALVRAYQRGLIVPHRAEPTGPEHTKKENR